MSKYILTVGEVKLLADLIGQKLNKITYDGWLYRLNFDGLEIEIYPDEIPAPTKTNPLGDIVTLRVKEITPMQGYAKSIMKNCGYITNIFRLESLVKIENPRISEPIKILDVEIPAGMGWNNILYNPVDMKEKKNYNQALLGLQFKTDKNIFFTLYTNSVGYSVLYEKGRKLPDELTGRCESTQLLPNHAGID